MDSKFFNNYQNFLLFLAVDANVMFYVWVLLIIYFVCNVCVCVVNSISMCDSVPKALLNKHDTKLKSSVITRKRRQHCSLCFISCKTKLLCCKSGSPISSDMIFYMCHRYEWSQAFKWCIITVQWVPCLPDWETGLRN